jgi:AcrB/AcrD/AcrF family
MLATGAGAESRQAIGVVVFYGVVISVFLTLAVVPALYTLVARNTRSPEAIGQLLDRLRESLPGVARRPRTEPGKSGN